MACCLEEGLDSSDMPSPGGARPGGR